MRGENAIDGKMLVHGDDIPFSKNGCEQAIISIRGFEMIFNSPQETVVFWSARCLDLFVGNARAQLIGGDLNVFEVFKCKILEGKL